MLYPYTVQYQTNSHKFCLESLAVEENAPMAKVESGRPWAFLVSLHSEIIWTSDFHYSSIVQGTCVGFKLM